MTLDEAVKRLVPRPVEALQLRDAFGLTVDLYPSCRYELIGDWLIVGDDSADKVGAALDGRGLHFLRSDGDRFVNSTLELLRDFIQIYVDVRARHVCCDDEPTADLDEICRRFEVLDPPAMGTTATWFNFLDMIRGYP